MLWKKRRPRRASLAPGVSEERTVQNLDGDSLGMTIAEYDAVRAPEALASIRTLCHAPFTVMDLGPQGQVTTCNHIHRVLGDLHEANWLEIFRGAAWTGLRRSMLEYKVSELDCRHCARQIRAGHPGSAFAQGRFDAFPGVTAKPDYPTVIFFRLSNVCNLKCVMCNGTLSHRIRKEREKLPPLDPPPYDDEFFRQMEEVLPNVKYVEFYGGEPFLIPEHLRILDIIEKTGAQTRIYVNTNGTTLTPRIKELIERLNFTTVAVSVDGVTEVVNARQRVGVDHQKLMINLQWLLELRRRKPIVVCLNVTETRFNWYHLPEIFRFAAEHRIYLHINTCLHPADCTIYDLPTEEVAYIDDYFERARHRLGSALRPQPGGDNADSYAHLQAMVRDELGARRAGRKRPDPHHHTRAPILGGLMSVPELGPAPFDTPAAALEEIERARHFEVWAFLQRLRDAWQRSLPGGEPWRPVAAALDRLTPLP